MSDYYNTLGVTRTATADEIKQAYRRLASQHHPDKGGDTAKFQQIEEAYRTLSDPTKRQAYDNPQPQFNGFGPGGNPFGGQTPFDFDAIFQMFGARPMHGDPNDMLRHRQSAPMAKLNLWISLYDSAVAGQRVINVGSAHGTSNVEISIPAGIEDGDTVRYAKVGPGGTDLIITFRINPDNVWQRDREHLHRTIAVNVWDLILGGDIEVDTIMNSRVVVVIPAMTQPGTVLRVRGHGMPRKNQNSRGDMLVRVNGELPKTVSPELLEQIRLARSQ